MKYWVLSVTTESGDDHAYIITGTGKPTDDQIGAYLREKLPDEFHKDWGPGFVIWRLTETAPHSFEGGNHE